MRGSVRENEVDRLTYRLDLLGFVLRDPDAVHLTWLLAPGADYKIAVKQYDPPNIRTWKPAAPIRSIAADVLAVPGMRNPIRHRGVSAMRSPLVKSLLLAGLSLIAKTSRCEESNPRRHARWSRPAPGSAISPDRVR